MSLIEFISNYITISVLIGLFTYRMINSFLENIFYRIIDFKILPDSFFWDFNKVYNVNGERIHAKYNRDKVEHPIMYGKFLKDFITWITLITIFYYISKIKK